MLPGNNPDILRRQTYANEESLRVRNETHEQYTVPKVNFAEWALGMVHWRGDEHVLDVGCGTGRYRNELLRILPSITYTGIDFSPAMVNNKPGHALADVQALPFHDGTFDVVMANHMLYHVPDIDLAIRECQRVLKPDGILLATTNSEHTMPEFHALFRRAIVLLSDPGTRNNEPPPAAHLVFSLENGTRQLARHFYAVVRYDLPGSLVFPNTDPVIAYLESTRSLREPLLPNGVHWDEMMLMVREQINRLMSHFGELVVNKLSGVLIATNRGDFIRDYVEKLEDSR